MSCRAAARAGISLWRCWRGPVTLQRLGRCTGAVAAGGRPPGLSPWELSDCRRTSALGWHHPFHAALSAADDRGQPCLVDGNNFLLAACEAALDPSLIGRPLVGALPNNDGCIRGPESAEARALGIAIEARPTSRCAANSNVSRGGAAPNYALYAELSSG